jgi:hypothetical protein
MAWSMRTVLACEWAGTGERQSRMLSQIINLLPGVLAAVAGFFSILFMDFLAVQSSWLRFCVFIVIYIVVNIAFDKAMTAYGTKK